MAGRHKLGAPFVCDPKERWKFDRRVAENARIRRSAVQIGLNKRRYDVFFECIAHIGNAEIDSGRLCRGTGGGGIIAVSAAFQIDAEDFIPVAGEKLRGDGRINAAGKTENSTHV